MSHRKWNAVLLSKELGGKCGSWLVYAERGKLFARMYTEYVYSNAALSAMKKLQSWNSLTGSYLVHWPGLFLGSVCKFSLTKAGMHSRQYILRGVLFYYQDHIIASGQLLGSCFTVLAEGCQNRAILPIVSYYVKTKPMDMKKVCELCEIFFTDVPYTDLQKVKRGEQRRLFTLALSEWYFFLGNLLSNNFVCDHKGYCEYCMFVLR